MKYFREACCTGLDAVAQACQHGASRIELCERLETGGVTPSRETIREALKICADIGDGTIREAPRICAGAHKLPETDAIQGWKDADGKQDRTDADTRQDWTGSDSRLGIPVNVLVRPRGGDFVYSEAEIQAMLGDIRVCKSLGANAVVIGALLPDGNIDLETMRRLIAEARPLQVTFHRAFDVCANPAESLEKIIGLGCERLLSSGHEADAYSGRFTLAAMTVQAAGRIIIMPGCGVRPSNIDEIAAVSHATEFHSSILTGWEAVDIEK